MSNSDLQARPVYHRKRDSIEAHPTIMFAALAVSRWTELSLLLAAAASLINHIHEVRKGQ